MTDDLGPGGERLLRKIALQYDDVIADVCRRFILGELEDRHRYTAVTLPESVGVPERMFPAFPQLPRYHKD